MHIEGHSEGDKIAEIYFNPFSYTYHGDTKRVEQMISSWKKDNGPLLLRGDVKEFDDGSSEHRTRVVDDEQKKMEHAVELLNMTKAPGYYKIVDG